eukprot:4796533-Prymnesium_polylepis.1
MSAVAGHDTQDTRTSGVGPHSTKRGNVVALPQHRRAGTQNNLALGFLTAGFSGEDVYCTTWRHGHGHGDMDMVIASTDRFSVGPGRAYSEPPLTAGTRYETAQLGLIRLEARRRVQDSILGRIGSVLRQLRLSMTEMSPKVMDLMRQGVLRAATQSVTRYETA